MPANKIRLKSSQKSVSQFFSFWHFPVYKIPSFVFGSISFHYTTWRNSPSQCAACLIWLPAQLFDSCASKLTVFCPLLFLMGSAELVSHSSWLFFSCWSSCGVSEVSSFLSVPLPSCLPNVSTACERKSACQVDYFHLIKPAPCPFCLSVFPSQWFTHSMSRPLASFSLFILSQSL